jgi:iron complex outermembrane receptor protein
MARLFTCACTKQRTRSENGRTITRKLPVIHQGKLASLSFRYPQCKNVFWRFSTYRCRGNTYLNLLDAGIINRIEVLKGPEAGSFGANSGGVILISPVGRKFDSSYASAGLSIGSFGTVHPKVNVQQTFNHYRINIAGGFQQSDGYRENSASDRQYLQIYQQLNYEQKLQLKALLIYSNLLYETPGGLTLEQFRTTPTAARYPTATLPGAAQQKARVTNQTVYGGLSLNLYFSPHVKQNITVFASHTNFENPFITNYEVRNETSAGARTYIEVSNNTDSRIHLKWQTGLEAQRTGAEINNFGNREGMRDTLQDADEVIADQRFYFTRISMLAYKRLTLEGALSLNYYQYYYRDRMQTLANRFDHQTFVPQLMPRVGLAYLIRPDFSWRVSVSRGYSAPTIAEIRPSDNVVYTNLQPENGWNYETGIRMNGMAGMVSIDAAVFYYRLQKAIVRRVNESGTEYFVNSGGTKQLGLETQLSLWIVKPRSNSLLRGFQLWDSYTFSHFTFSNYSNASADYSGNDLTGVPKNVNVAGLNLYFPLNLFLFAQYNYTAQIPLNDANSVLADEYHLVQLKGGWKKVWGRAVFDFFAGSDNMPNQSYSLGNDLNAAGGRYYNPAPPRNYFAGFTVTL